MNIKLKAAAAASVAGVLALTACSANADSESLDVVGFSILQTPNEEVFKQFEATDAGKDVTFKTAYGASGDMSRGVADGQPADYVQFSLETDMTRLVDADLVDASWSDTPTNGIVSSSVVVIVTRPGNPLGIDSWDDLVKDGVEVITPNPASSGGARWNILAAWGSVIAQGGTEEDAEKFVGQLLENTINMPGSAREATSAFVDNGQGDVLLSYENEAILAKQSGQDIDYVVPPQTLLIENPGAVTKDADEKAKDYLDFVVSEQGQEIYASFGFRPVGVTLTEFDTEGANDPTNPFPAPETLLTIGNDFGGWGEAASKFFDEENGIIFQLMVEAGQSLE